MLSSARSLLSPIRTSTATASLGAAALLVLSPSAFADTAVGTIQRPADPSDNSNLIQRLKRTNLLNGNEVVDRLALLGDGNPPFRNTGKFLTPNPYDPQYRESYASLEALRYPLPRNAHNHELDDSSGTFLFYGQEPVLRWHLSLDSNTEVCAVQFVDAARADYRLRTFRDREAAIREGHFVTHRHHCGTCSSLRDLAVYLAKPDLTSPARTCARRWTTAGVKACLMEEVGFEEPCAETWAYNVMHTRRRCSGTCIRHYGLWDVLTNNMGDAHNDERGNLNPCLACDEFASGPGFQYAAGRTRRTSGLRSAILRPTDEIYDVDHRLYFRVEHGTEGPACPSSALLIGLFRSVDFTRP